MSYISRQPIYYPKSVSCEMKENNGQTVLWISGEYGTWFYRLPINSNVYKITLTSAHIHITINKFYNIHKYYYKTAYKFSMPTLAAHLSLLSVIFRRMIVGAGVGFKKYLRVRGVGYKFEVINLRLKAKVGFTHLIQKQLPSEFFIKFSRKSKVIRFRSKSLTKLTGVLSNIRGQKKPDVYKGKGIRYKHDPVRRKPGGKQKNKTAGKKKKKKTKAPEVRKPRRFRPIRKVKKI